MKIMIMKATPRMILGLLQCIDKNEGNISNMKNCIHMHLERFGGKKKQRNVRSDVYGVAFPSLRKLKLTRGHGQLLKLNCNGKMLIRCDSIGGTEEFRYHFGRILYEIDEATSKVLSSLAEVSDGIRPNPMTYGQLVQTLTRKGIDTFEKDERLRKWLPFLEFVGLVIEQQQGLQANLALMEEYKAERATVSFDKFEKLLFEEYGELQKKEGIYVSICMLVERTCARLRETGEFFTTFDFERYFADLLNKYSSLQERKILLSQPGKREEEGIYIDNTYYYFVSIYDVKENQL
jgi:hypothetical protein